MTTDDQTEVQRLAMATRIREAREYIGLSQEDVARALNLSRPAITNLESGSRRVEAVELDKLGRLYGRSVNFLLTGEEPVTAGTTPEKVAFLARALKGLSERDVAEVARFADFLRRSGEPKVPPKQPTKRTK
jgi:DNA-binding XRE family transcriptional regulator